MKIKTKQIILFFSILCIAFECKYITIIPIPFSNYIKQLIYIGLFIYCRFNQIAKNRIHQYVKYIDMFLMCFYILLFTELLYTLTLQRVSIFVGISNAISGYLKFLFVYPLIYLFTSYSFKKIIHLLIGICGFIVIYQILGAALYNTSEIVINTNMIDRIAWTRSGNIRISSTSIAWLILLLSFIESKYVLVNKWLYRSIWIITLIYMIFVNQSRAQYIATFVALILMFFFRKRRSRRQIFIYVLFCLAIIIFLNSSAFNELLNSFSENSETDTLSIRLIYLDYMYDEFLKHKFWGFGLIGETVEISGRIIYFIDFGFIGDYLQIGVISILIRLCKNIRKSLKNNPYLLEISIGILTFLIVGMIGFSSIQESRNFALPCIWAITEYLGTNRKVENTT